MKVTKEEVDKAAFAAVRAFAYADVAGADDEAAANDKARYAWEKYIKLKRERENESNSRTS